MKYIVKIIKANENLTESIVTKDNRPRIFKDQDEVKEFLKTMAASRESFREVRYIDDFTIMFGAYEYGCALIYKAVSYASITPFKGTIKR